MYSYSVLFLRRTPELFSPALCDFFPTLFPKKNIFWGESQFYYLSRPMEFQCQQGHLVDCIFFDILHCTSLSIYFLPKPQDNKAELLHSGFFSNEFISFSLSSPLQNNLLVE